MTSGQDFYEKERKHIIFRRLKRLGGYHEDEILKDM